MMLLCGSSLTARASRNCAAAQSLAALRRHSGHERPKLWAELNEATDRAVADASARGGRGEDGGG